MAKIYGALEVAQLEWFTQSPDTRPSAASNTYRVIYASDVKQVQISDGTNWIAFINGSTNQTLAGNITFSGEQIFTGLHRLSVTTDSSSTGAIIALNNTTPVIEFTAAVTSISGVANSASGATVMLVNRTGGTVAVLDEDTGATAANRIRTGTGAQISLANNASILLTYVGDSRWHVIGGSGSGSGSAGINYITNGSAEADTLGWATYAESDAVTFQDTGDTVTLNSHGLSNGNQISFTSITSTTGISTNTLYFVVTATTNTFQVATSLGGSALPLTTNGSGTLVRFVPKTGSGGSSSLSISRSTSNPLIGTASFILTKGGSANLEGQGWEYDFTIDRGYQAKVLQISFQYLVNSGTFVAGSSSTVSDVTVYIYDVTNAQIIQPSSFKLLSNNASISDTFNATFQTASNSTSYRLIFHVSTPSTANYELKVDGISVSPSTYVYGTPVTDWQAYTPTFQGFGTPTSVQFQWRRVGADLEVRGRFNPGTSTAVEARVSFPSGLTSADTSLIPALQIAGMAASNATAANSRTVLIEPSVTYFTFGVTTNGPLTRNNGNVVATSPEVFAFFAKVAIQGWSSSVQTSDQTDTRVVAARYYQNANTAQSTYLDFPTRQIDTHAAVTTGSGVWKFTCPVAGIYKVSVFYSGAASNTVQLYKNGAVFPLSGNNAVIVSSDTINGVGTGSTMVELVTGDFIQLFVTSNAVMNGHVSIERLSGPSAIAASETVALRYTNTAGSSYGTSDTLMPFATKDYDTHNAWVTNTFTAPISGKYLANIILTSASTGIVLNAVLYKNGASFCQVGAGYSTGSTRSVGSATVSLNSGDTLSFYVSGSVAGSLSTVAGLNHFSITRVGN